MGMGEMNIFIQTVSPSVTLRRVQELLARYPQLSDYRAGYRKDVDDEYTPVWPPGFGAFKVA